MGEWVNAFGKLLGESEAVGRRSIGALHFPFTHSNVEYFALSVAADAGDRKCEANLSRQWPAHIDSAFVKSHWALTPLSGFSEPSNHENMQHQTAALDFFFFPQEAANRG